ncbi:MAG: TetR family transcriptional regulator [Alphaproteobacteria bacterium]|nr:TetR family transcriptional regulator [Alphaproteobacteria bacterium]MCW5742161.1 TetR family transcriptional regulator [Alphaproteobacteria bacterium]
MQAAPSTETKLTKAEKTRARLIEVAKRLFQEHGSDEVTVRTIAAAANIEAGSIYYHFASRDEIMRAVLESGVEGARQQVMRAIEAAGVGSSPLVRLRAALGAHFKYTLREHFSSRLKSIRRLPKRLREQHMKQEREYAAIFAGLLREAERGGLLKSGFDLSVVRMLAMGALTWAAEWFDPEGEMSADEVADELMRVLSGGIVRGSGDQERL